MLNQLTANKAVSWPRKALTHSDSTARELLEQDCDLTVFPVSFSVGDAVCTISAATCFPEPFISEGKRLGYVHRNFAGNRFSDHVALLSVFQAWDDARYGFEREEL